MILSYYVKRASFPRLNHEYEITLDQKPSMYSYIVDYEVDIDLECLKKYFVWTIGEYTFSTWDKTKQDGFMRAIELAYDHDLFSSEVLEENDDFITFAKEYFSGDMLDYLDSQEEREKD